MATTTGIELKKNTITAAKEAKTLKGMLEMPAYKNKFSEMLGKKAAGFMSSIIAVANNNKLLAKAEPSTVIGAAAQAAMLDLPINQSLGFAYIVPYKGAAQFQLGYKGYIQLAQRSGQYVDIGAKTVYEGELEYENRLLDKFKFGEVPPKRQAQKVAIKFGCLCKLKRKYLRDPARFVLAAYGDIIKAVCLNLIPRGGPAVYQQDPALLIRFVFVHFVVVIDTVAEF